jgi:hypothetical protein
MNIRDEVRNSIVSSKVSFQAMPIALRWISFFCFFGILFAGSVFPFWKFHLNGEVVSYKEFWASGVGLEMFLLGLLLPMCGFGFLKKRNWSRLLFLIVVFWTVFITPALHDIAPIFHLNQVLNLLVLCSLVWYLYFKSSVKEYFKV